MFKLNLKFFNLCLETSVTDLLSNLPVVNVNASSFYPFSLPALLS